MTSLALKCESIHSYTRPFFNVACSSLGCPSAESKRQTELQDKFVICQVPFYTEGEDSLGRTIDSQAALNHNARKMALAVRSRHRVQHDIKRHGDILPRLLPEHADEVIIKGSVRARVLVQVESVYVVHRRAVFPVLPIPFRKTIRKRERKDARTRTLQYSYQQPQQQSLSTPKQANPS